MKRRYIVLLDEATKEQDDQLRNYIKENGLGWWHWLSNSWLLSDPRGTLSASEIRDKINEIYDGVHTIVIELYKGGDTWAGFGPKTEKKDMFRWFHETWKAD
jgi:hypothetical protein